MKAQEEHLFNAMGHLLRLQHECSCTVSAECGRLDLTVTQIAYLKLIDEQGDVSFSRLAELTRSSKPTITEMINRCARQGCVYRERSCEDARIQYIRLTERGQRIARAEEMTLRRTIEILMHRLNEGERTLLIELLEKLE